jgi:hypothetical protein
MGSRSSTASPPGRWPPTCPPGTDPKQETSAEIVAASEDGMTLVYTDSPLGVVGLIDIRDPRAPKAGGTVRMGGEPTSVAIAGGRAIVGVNTSKSFTEPSGHLAAIDLASGAIGVRCELGGQPDSVAVSPDTSMVASEDPEPEFVHINAANEKDLVKDGGPRAHVMIYELQEAAPAYPQIRSVTTEDGTPIGWGALSGLAADPARPGILYAVNDSFYRMQPTIFTIDATSTPATIVKATPVTRNGSPAQKLDLEGIASDGKGGFWLASEGRTDRLIPHAILHVDAEGEITKEIGLPPELMAAEKRFGFEGITPPSARATTSPCGWRFSANGATTRRAS